MPRERQNPPAETNERPHSPISTGSTGSTPIGIICRNLPSSRGGEAGGSRCWDYPCGMIFTIDAMASILNRGANLPKTIVNQGANLPKLVLYSQNIVPILYKRSDGDDQALKSMNMSWVYALASVVSCYRTRKSESKEETIIMMTSEITWPFVQDDMCLSPSAAEEIIGKAVIEAAKEIKENNSEEFARVFEYYKGPSDVLATIIPSGQAVTSKHIIRVLFKIVCHLEYFEEKNSAYEWGASSSTPLFLTRKKRSLLETCVTTSILALMHRGQITDRKLTAVVTGSFGEQNGLICEPMTIQAFYNRIKSCVNSTFAQAYHKKMLELIPMQACLRLHLTVMQMPKAGLANYYWILDSILTFQWINWTRFKAEYGKDWDEFHKAKAEIGDNEFYGYNQNLDKVKITNYPRLAYFGFRVQRDLAGLDTLKSFKGKHMLPVFERDWIDTFLEETLKVAKAKETDLSRLYEGRTLETVDPAIGAFIA